MSEQGTAGARWCGWIEAARARARGLLGVIKRNATRTRSAAGSRLDDLERQLMDAREGLDRLEELEDEVWERFRGGVRSARFKLESAAASALGSLKKGDDREA